MKTSLRRMSLLGLLGLLLAQPARAEDTRPPAISDVQASKSGTKVTVKAKITDETGVLQAQVMWRPQGGGSFDSVSMTGANDKFSATFDAKGGTIEYFVQAIDELGNGPSKSPQSSLTVSGKSGGEAVASNEPRKHRGRGRRHHKAETPPAEGSAEAPAESGGGSAEATAESGSGSAEAGSGEAGSGEAATASADTATDKPAIEHEKPAETPAGQDLTLKAKITGGGIAKALVWIRKPGEGKFSKSIPMEKKEGDDWEVVVPADAAQGAMEYVIQARNEKGSTYQGDGGPSKPFAITFGAAKASGGAATASSDQASGGAFVFAHKPLASRVPGAANSIRVQATPPTEAEAPTKAMVLVHDASGDQVIDLAPDESGGIGGFAGSLPAANGNAFYYQVVACNKDKCAADTGSKKSWHAVAVTNDADAKPPEPYTEASSKAPANLPE